MGDTKLGNRETPAIKDCRLCKEGKLNNNEAHIVFSCNTVNEIIEEEMPALKNFKEKHKNKDGNKKLKMLLGGDKCKKEILLERGKQLANLLGRIQDFLNESDFVDMIQGMKD